MFQLFKVTNVIRFIFAGFLIVKRHTTNTGSESDELLLNEQVNWYNNLLNSTQNDYIKSIIENARSSKDVW